MLSKFSFVTIAAFAIFVAIPFSVLRAEVGDPTLRTDHTTYPGEGAFQTIEQCVDFATEGAQTPQEKAIAMYRWILQHQFHDDSPQQWQVGGNVPDVVRLKDEMVPFDANAARFSYGYGLCGTVHAWNEPYWRELGFRARRRAFPGHTNSEIEYAGRWHAFDTDMAGLLFNPDGSVAGYDDIARNPNLVQHSRPPIPCYPFLWPEDFEVMKEGWNEVAKKGADEFYSLYAGGYAAKPGIVHLRSGETFTRWFDRDHFGGIEKRRFWYASPDRRGGPFRNWTYVNREDTDHVPDIERYELRGDASYCNAQFVYVPDFDSPSYLEGVVDASDNLGQGSKSKLGSSDGKAAWVTFFHRSPYVIAGDPVDDKNSMSGEATDGLVISGNTQGKVSIEFSVDEGQSWQEFGFVTGDFKVDLTEFVKGRYGWQIRFLMEGQSGIDRLLFDTTCQMNQSIYPRLTAGGSAIFYRAGSRGVVTVQPNFTLAEDQLASVEKSDFRSANLKFQRRTNTLNRVYETTDNQPGQVVFRVKSPGPLTQINAAAKFAVRVPTPENADFHLEYSTDNGATWKALGEADLPTDNQYSSGWVYGSAKIAESDVREALVRVHLYQNGYATGLLDFEGYGIYETPSTRPLTITYGWKEGGTLETFVETVDAGVTEKRFRVPTGDQVVDEFVRLEVE